jgi:hypothetical protein
MQVQGPCSLPVPQVCEQGVQGPVHQEEQGPSQQGCTKQAFF